MSEQENKDSAQPIADSTPKAAPKKKAAGEKASRSKKTPGLRVTAQKDGFRRAGREWSTAAIDVPVSELSKEQIAQLNGERLLSVQEIEIGQ